MKKNILIMLAVLTAAVFLSGCGGGETPSPSVTPSVPAPATSPVTTPSSPPASPGSTEPASPPELPEPVAAAYKGELFMGTTTSTDNTGLLDYLAPAFLFDTGWELKWTSVGTGAAIQLGMDGEVDVILVHSKAREETFVADGYGVERFQVMYNDYVIVGPPGGAIVYTNDIDSAFKQIMDESLVFVSRGDDSGTHTAETGIWKALSLDYESNPNYISAGAGMSATIIMADEMEGYTLSDRGTWLSTKQNASINVGLEIICEGDIKLFNQYGVIAVNPEMYPYVNNEGANAFIEWLCSPEIQALIGQFGVAEYGEPLFTPNAG